MSHKLTGAHHDRPLAAPGLTSYRMQGRYGWIMIGARDHADAVREARRSSPHVLATGLQVWDGAAYAPVPMFTAAGGDGSVTVCATTGEVIDRDDGAYERFSRWDVAEWRSYYPGEELAGITVDVLDMGAWDTFGAYTPAEQDFRDELALIHAA